MTATDTTVKDLSTLNLEGAVETFLADDVVVGGTYNYNAAVAKPEEIYIKKAFDVKLVSGLDGWLGGGAGFEGVALGPVTRPTARWRSVSNHPPSPSSLTQTRTNTNPPKTNHRVTSPSTRASASRTRWRR